MQQMPQMQGFHVPPPQQVGLHGMPGVNVQGMPMQHPGGMQMPPVGMMPSMPGMQGLPGGPLGAPGMQGLPQNMLLPGSMPGAGLGQFGGMMLPQPGGMPQHQLPLPGAPMTMNAPDSTLNALLGSGAGGDAAGNDQDPRAMGQRRGETREQAENRERKEDVEKVKCHLHKKVNSKCKFCKKYQEALAALEKQGEDSRKGNDSSRRGRRKLDRAISEDRDNTHGPLELASAKTFGFSGLLQTHIVECAHFKSLLTLESFEQLVDEAYQFANSVEPYMANSGTLPSALFCCLYRFFTLGLDGSQLRRLLDSTESPYIRCCGFLYVRFGLPHDQFLPWLAEYVLDDEEFKPSPDSDFRITVGEYVEGLMAQDKYYNTVLPRLPMVTKRQVEERLAPVAQYRKRMRANKEILQVFRESGQKIQSNVGGEWLEGSIIELDEGAPTRPKVRVRMDDGTEEYVHLGKVIIIEKRGPRARSRSRGRRTGSPRIDWSREKGRSDAELIDEMRSREREKAVCSTGKEYARKPVGYKAACALPREQGAASYRLMEEETFVPITRQKRVRTPSPEREMGGRRPSAEHQARMQQLFEKYGNVRGPDAAQGRSDEVDRPDVMRLG